MFEDSLFAYNNQCSLQYRIFFKKSYSSVRLKIQSYIEYNASLFLPAQNAPSAEGAALCRGVEDMGCYFNVHTFLLSAASISKEERSRWAEFVSMNPVLLVIDTLCDQGLCIYVVS